MNLKLSVRQVLGRARQNWLRRPRLALVSNAMVREQRAVRAGHTEFAKDQRRRYLIRRNVHMLEKGLTMQPRRDTFATGYIRETVDAVRDCLTNLETEESLWILTVLEQYFAATEASESAAIHQAREMFEEFIGGTHVELSHGPRPVSMPHEDGDHDVLARIAHGRRSVRWFTGSPVHRNFVDSAIRVAMEAPTACNRSPYRFEIFDRSDDVERVADLAMGTRGYGQQITGLIVVVGLLNAFFDERDRHLIYIDSSLAAMSLILGFESQGIASCIINWPDIPERELKMRKLLQLSKSEKVVMLVAYGYPLSGSLAPHSGKQSIDEARRFRQLGGSK